MSSLGAWVLENLNVSRVGRLTPLDRWRNELGHVVSDACEGIRSTYNWATSLNIPDEILEPYVYSPLPTKHSIRLLSFSSDAKFGYSCSLSTFELSTAPRYQALSEFKVDGKALVVRPSLDLHEALGRLWSANTIDREYLWADAICMNQEDALERAAQMLIVGDIYRQASQVVAWLGAQLTFSFLGIEFLKELDKIPKQKWAQMQTMDMTNEDIYSELRISPITEKKRRSLSGIWMRRRVWIVQEVALARRVSFVYRTYEFPMRLLFDVSKMLVLTGWGNQLMKYDTPDAASRQMLPPGGFASLAVMRPQLYPFKQLSPLDVMVFTRNRQANVDVDSVYGLLGILAMPMEKEPRELLVQPNLNKPSLEEGRENTKLMLIRHSEDLQVFHQVQEHQYGLLAVVPRGPSTGDSAWRQSR